jgi:glycosyltransferase involved in cell wall biosynthesis
MRIWLLQDYLRSGGTERQTILLAKEFTAAGHAVEVVTFRPGGTLAPSLAPLVPRVLQPFDTSLNWFAPGLLRAARRAAPDIILCMGRMANAHSGRLARNLPATAVVATLRTGKALPGPFRRSLAAVAHVVANSREAAARLAGDYRVPSAKISVIHNALVFPPGPEAAAAARARRALRTAHGASDSTVVMLCVGMFRPEKNQAGLLRIVAQLGPATTSDWQLWFVGEGPERAACTRLAAALGLAERARFLGFQADPAAAYASADLAVLTSQAESLSNFLIEAQAHGLPVIASEVGGVAECLLPGVTGDLVPCGDQDAFGAALRRWINDETLRRTAAPLARHFAREAFDPARQASAYLALFEGLRASR